MSKPRRLRPSQGGKLDRTSGPAGGMDPSDVPDDAEVRLSRQIGVDTAGCHDWSAVAVMDRKDGRLLASFRDDEAPPEKHECKVSKRVVDTITYCQLTKCNECGKVTAHDGSHSQVLSGPWVETLARIAFDLNDSRMNLSAGLHAALNGLPSSVRKACDNAAMANLAQTIEDALGNGEDKDGDSDGYDFG